MESDNNGGLDNAPRTKLSITIQQSNVAQGGGFVAEGAEAEITSEIVSPHTRLLQTVRAPGIDSIEDAKSLATILTMALVQDIRAVTKRGQLPHSKVTLSVSEGEENASVSIRYFGTDFRGDGRHTHKEIHLSNLSAKAVKEARQQAVRVLDEMCSDLTARNQERAQAALDSLVNHNVPLPSWARSVKIPSQ